MSNTNYVQYGAAYCGPDQWLNFDVSPTLRLQRIPLIGPLITRSRKTFPKTVKYGDIVTITANPSRTPNDHKLHMITLRRASDGFGWGARPGEVVD